MGFRKFGLQHDIYHSILPELKVQGADNLVVNVTVAVIPSYKPYFIISYIVPKGSRLKLWTMSE